MRPKCKPNFSNFGFSISLSSAFHTPTQYLKWRQMRPKCKPNFSNFDFSISLSSLRFTVRLSISNGGRRDQNANLISPILTSPFPSRLCVSHSDARRSVSVADSLIVWPNRRHRSSRRSFVVSASRYRLSRFWKSAIRLYLAADGHPQPLRSLALAYCTVFVTTDSVSP
ncbi:Hypothetical predicted protein [Olea europaea subsp. europaea]|uniref:Uncharacterized protein n=1 Tax=Olea europaea subsp. europaea TaxID=158383 RepID=A0A8S0RMB2_OLEEU|nr:Hypothetical predicted protein [Olea europaea subsp. europaea]